MAYEKQGVYLPEFEHDNCGVGFVVQIKNRKSHQIVQQGLRLLCNLDHRGALGADPDTGDGSGILIQIPHGGTMCTYCCCWCVCVVVCAPLGRWLED